jgi:hypothetical protein
MGATETLSIQPERTDAHVGLQCMEGNTVYGVGLRSKLV